MKVLVTGAAGFIGYHLVKRLLAEGYIVTGLDNINDYYDVNLKYARLIACGIQKASIEDDVLVNSSEYQRYKFQKTDLTNLSELEKLFKKQQFDIIINLAAQAGVRYSLENPHAYVQSNLVGFLNLLECCRHNKIKHLVYASSSSVYGMNDTVPFSEDDRVDYPVSLYAATKKSNEVIAHCYSHLYKIPTTGLRFFTVYGSYGRPDMSPMLFADAILSDRPIKVFNSGDMQRDFTFIDDIIEGVFQVTKNYPDVDSQKPYYRLLNIGNSKPVQLMEFIRIMEEAMERKAQLVLYPMQPGDVKVTFADTSKLQQVTGYKPGTDLKVGVKNFVEWYKSFYVKQ